MHFVDFALANAWLDFRDIELESGTPQRQILVLLGFRTSVAEALRKAHIGTPAVASKL